MKKGATVMGLNILLAGLAVLLAIVGVVSRVAK